MPIVMSLSPNDDAGGEEDNIQITIKQNKMSTERGHTEGTKRKKRCGYSPNLAC